MKTIMIASHKTSVHSSVTPVYVRFGRVSCKCQRNGICEIKQVEDVSEQETPGRAAYGYLEFQQGNLQLHLLSQSMSPTTREQCFAQQFFLVEEDFQQEITLSDHSTVVISIAIGRYPIERASHYITLRLSSGELSKAAK